MFNVQNLTVNNGVDIPVDAEVRFNLPITSRWVKIAYIKIVQLTAGKMEVDFDIWEVNDYNPGDRAQLYLRRLRRNIALTADQAGEYGEALSPLVPYKDRDEVEGYDEDRARYLHIRLRNSAAGTASDFAVMITLADMGEVN